MICIYGDDQFSIQPPYIDLFPVKWKTVCRGCCILNCFMLSSLPSLLPCNYFHAHLQIHYISFSHVAPFPGCLGSLSILKAKFHVPFHCIVHSKSYVACFVATMIIIICACKAPTIYNMYVARTQKQKGHFNFCVVTDLHCEEFFLVLIMKQPKALLGLLYQLQQRASGFLQTRATHTEMLLMCEVHDL